MLRGNYLRSFVYVECPPEETLDYRADESSSAGRILYLRHLKFSCSMIQKELAKELIAVHKATAARIIKRIETARGSDD